MTAGQLRLKFLGTRGGIDLRSRLHHRHSSLLVSGQGRAAIMFDCGADWLGRVTAIAPAAILLTHAHPDHAAGLIDGAPCPVYATEMTWNAISRYPIRTPKLIRFRQPCRIFGLEIEAFPVIHSLRARAIGFRVVGLGTSFFYVPDVLAIPDRRRALEGIRLYIGDGATLTRSIVRGTGRFRIGHASINEQLGWCAAAQIRNAVFTHCGSQIVAGDGRRLNAKLHRLASEHRIQARFAVDGMRLWR